jgi:hypothetical protein
MLELVDLMSDDRQRIRCDKCWKMKITERGIPGKRNDYRSKNRRIYVKKTDSELGLGKLKWGQGLNL